MTLAFVVLAAAAAEPARPTPEVVLGIGHGGVDGIRLRFAGIAADGKQSVAGIFTIVPMPSNDRLPEFEAIYEPMLAAVTFEKD